MKEEKKLKHHFFQRWYEQTENERIQSNWRVFCFTLIIYITLWLILAERVNIECTTGDLKIKADFNSSMSLKNLTFNGVNGMSCKIDMPIWSLKLLS